MSSAPKYKEHFKRSRPELKIIKDTNKEHVSEAIEKIKEVLKNKDQVEKAASIIEEMLKDGR